MDLTSSQWLALLVNVLAIGQPQRTIPWSVLPVPVASVQLVRTFEQPLEMQIKSQSDPGVTGACTCEKSDNAQLLPTETDFTTKS